MMTRKEFVCTLKLMGFEDHMYKREHMINTSNGMIAGIPTHAPICSMRKEKKTALEAMCSPGTLWINSASYPVALKEYTQWINNLTN